MTTTTAPRLDTATHDDTALLGQARRRVGLKMGLMAHATVFALVQLGWFLLSTLHHGSSPSHWPFWGWALGLAIHTVVVTVRLSGLSVRQRLLDAEMARLRRS